MPDPKLTAVICFANEGAEVEKTILSLQDTCGDDVEVLLINDASNDGFDYESVADKYGCRYFVNDEQIGPAHCRHKGLSWAKTENVIFLDAHMRFYGDRWHRRVNDIIARDPHTLYCTRSVPLKPGGKPSGAPTGIGASIQMDEPKFEDWLKPDWNIRPRGDADTSFVPCVLGGCYAVNRSFMQSIGGYRGLHRYGGEEPLISIKAWLSGGTCQVINSVEIGHIYRGGKPAPWKDTVRYFHFNKLATARIVMDDQDFKDAESKLSGVTNAQNVRDVYNSREKLVDTARADFLNIQKRPLEYFTGLNKAFRDGESITP